MALLRVTGAGILAAETELRVLPNGTSVLHLRIKCSDRKRGPTGGWVDGEPTYVTVVVYGKPAENLAKSAQIGDLVLVQGRLRMREWTDKATGTRRTVYEVVADESGLATTFHPAQVDRGTAEDPWAATK